MRSHSYFVIRIKLQFNPWDCFLRKKKLVNFRRYFAVVFIRKIKNRHRAYIIYLCRHNNGKFFILIKNNNNNNNDDETTAIKRKILYI